MLFPLELYTRFRDTGNQVINSHPYSYTLQEYGGTVQEPYKVISTSSSSGNSYTKYRKTMWDNPTPNFKARSARGEVINSRMESCYEQFHSPTVSWTDYITYRYGTAPNYYYWGHNWTGTVPIGNDLVNGGNWYYPSQPSIDASIISEALTEAWSRVSVNEAQVLVQMAESEKTVRSLISILRRVTTIIRAVEGLRVKELLRQIKPKELANRYMELRYALRPLFYDAKGLIAVLRGDVTPERQTFRAHRARLSAVNESNVICYQNDYDLFRGTTHAERSLEVRSGVLTSLETITCLDKWGFGEPIQAMWELIPFSFIIDWFFNVGKTIASWTPSASLKALASWNVVTDTTFLASTVVSGERKYTGYYSSNLNKAGTYSKTIICKYRVPTPDRPILPQFKMNLTWWKTLDLGIILQQIAKSIGK